VDDPLGAVDRHPDVRLDPVVAHRQQHSAGLPACAQRRRHGGQRVARVEHLPAHQVGGQVPVAQPEPRGRHVVRDQLVPGVEALVLPAPAARLVDAAAQGVHDGVQVRADPQAVQGDVVAGVHHHRQLGVRHRRLQAAQEARAADAAGQRDDLHAR
jgi:hypothetical protein